MKIETEPNPEIIVDLTELIAGKYTVRISGNGKRHEYQVVLNGK